MSETLKIIETKLQQLYQSNPKDKNYSIPSVWQEEHYNSDLTDSDGRLTGKILKVNPFEFFLDRISRIKNLTNEFKSTFKDNIVSSATDTDYKKRKTADEKDWSANAVVYNMFVRYTTAYGHDGDGKISIIPNQSGFRETGTFLKAIALLPYILSYGINTIHLLPVTSIGEDGKKGSLGSPYAIKNPYKISEDLAEPVLGLDAETEFKAFVEAAHLLGMKVVSEFVFRTSSLDSDLAIEHPEWFYWIKITNNEFRPPVFTEKELIKIKEKIEKQDFENLPQPDKVYRDLFVDTPVKVFIENGRIKGITKEGETCQIPCGFADWPPDDLQPVWSDVTYLKLYSHPDFNYIAYNTVRMYDKKLTKASNITPGLWNNITGIIPYYRDNFGIDGVMIDMGHALPPNLMKDIVEKARSERADEKLSEKSEALLNQNNPKSNTDFVFWEENFTLTQKSKKQGYNAVLGYMPFDEHINWKLNKVLRMLSEGTNPLPFFLSPETHNTPRAATKPGGIQYSKFAWAINNFLSGIVFLHSGFELGETTPVNTGLCFEPEEMKAFPPEKLPLFSEGALNWDNPANLPGYFKYISQLRSRLIEPHEDKNKYQTLIFLEHLDDNIIAFIRRFKDGTTVLIAGNMNPYNEKRSEIHFPFNVTEAFNLTMEQKKENISRSVLSDGSENTLNLNIKPFEVLIFEIK